MTAPRGQTQNQAPSFFKTLFASKDQTEIYKVQKDDKWMGKASAYNMTAALKANEPALIEIPVGPFPDPWRLFFRKKARG